MQGPSHMPRLEALRARIAALEARPVLAEGPGRHAGRSILSARDLVCPPEGLLHEIFADEQRSSGGALGFALGLARGFLAPSRPAVLYLELSRNAQELGLPYGPGLAAFGLDPDSLVLGRVTNLGELLWAMEEAIACRAIAAVVAEVPGSAQGLDFTVSRRLSLRAAATKTSAIFVRYGTGREASAAKLRWRVASAPSAAPAFDPLAPGSPRFFVTVEKARLGAGAQALEGQSFAFDWVDHGFVLVTRDAARRSAGALAPASGSEPAALGDRLHRAG